MAEQIYEMSGNGGESDADGLIQQLANTISKMGAAFGEMVKIVQKTSWYKNAITVDPGATVFAISTADELIGLAEIVNGDWIGEPKRDNFSGKVIRLTADIELSPLDNWTPIGDFSAHKNSVFRGTFDGGGHVISGLTIYRPDTNYQGLFGRIDGGRVENLELAGVNICGKNEIGGVAGCVDGSSVVNCRTAGTVRGGDIVGGVAGSVYHSSSVAGCKSAAAVIGKGFCVGGLAGEVFGESSITNSCFTGAVSGNNNAGDIAGITGDDCAVIDCKAQNSITAAEPPPAHFKAVFRVTVSPVDVWAGKGKTRQFTANVFGESEDKTVAWDVACNKSGSTTISADGLLSVAADETAESLFITAASTVNTVVSDTIKISIAEHGPDTRWYADAVAADPDAARFAISTADELAGLAEIVNGTWGGLPASDCFKGKTVKLIADIDLSAYNNWVPIGAEMVDTGNKFSGTFDGNWHVIKNLVIDRPDANCQGLFGEINGYFTNNGGGVENLGLDGVNVRGYGYIGGLAGKIAVKVNVVNCYSAGTVSGYENVGGLVGDAANRCGIINCHSSGAVNGNWSVGGLAGGAGNRCGIINCYSAGAVNGNRDVGGVVGGLSGSYLLNCHSTGAASGNDDVGGITAIYYEEEEKDPNHNENTFLNNTAGAEMANTAGNTECRKKGAENHDGEDAAAVNINGTNNGRLPEDSTHARALYFRGVAYNLIGEYDKAIAEFEAVLRVCPNHWTANGALEEVRGKMAGGR